LLVGGGFVEGFGEPCVGAFEGVVEGGGVGAVGGLDEAFAEFVEAAGCGEVGDDAGVVGGVGDGAAFFEVLEVGGSAGAGDVAAAGEFGGDGGDFDGVAAVVEVDGGAVDEFVAGLPEVLGGDPAGDVGEGLWGVAEEGADDGLFGGGVGGGGWWGVGVVGWFVFVGWWFEVVDGHAAPAPGSPPG
jgi:type IV secretion system protein TrbL